MRIALALGVFGLVGCSQAGPSSVDDKPAISPTQPEVEPPLEPDDEPTPDPQSAAIAVHMTSATLADDCGGGPSTPPQVRQEQRQRSAVKGDVSKRGRASRACEQSSIQLAITAPADAKSATMTVKSVELFHESGTLIGKLEARAPSVWSDEGGYVPWNETVEPAQDLSVSYAVAQPDWTKVEDRWNQTYTVKAVLSIAGAEQTVQQNVEVDAPTSLPPNVRT